jgi:type IV pilus assembly protein PilA
MIVVAIIGIMAAVAIPAFMKYIRRSKTTEAAMNLRKLFDASVAAFGEEWTMQDGSMAMKAFSHSVGPTPTANSCCPTKCSPTGDFSDERWQYLNFSIDDPHYYWYTYVSAGTETTSSFTARANGNLDCDAVYSTFERVGSVTAGTGYGVQGGAELYKANPLE